MADKAKAPYSPIFIVGAPRSGTTLLQYMLRSHPHLSFPTGESHFFIPLYKNRKAFGDLTLRENVRRVLESMVAINRDFIETDLQGLRFDMDTLTEEFAALHCDGIPQLLNALYIKNASGEGKVRWGDKTPYYVLHMQLIKEMFPTAQFVHIIRDGRDAAISMLDRKYDLNIFNIYHAAEIWTRYVKTGIETGRQLGAAAYYQLRYEDLLNDPESCLRNVCGFLDEPYTDALIYYKPAADTHGKTPMLKGGLVKDNVDKWAKKMAKSQIRIFEGVASTLLIDCGYGLATSGCPIPRVLSHLYRGHIRLCNFWIRQIRAGKIRDRNR